MAVSLIHLWSTDFHYFKQVRVAGLHSGSENVVGLVRVVGVVRLVVLVHVARVDTSARVPWGSFCSDQADAAAGGEDGDEAKHQEGEGDDSPHHKPKDAPP